jgi:arylformamidase
MKAAARNGEWIDISVPLSNGMVHWPGDPEFHSERVQSMSNGHVCNVTQVSTSVHVGTHMDAPIHFIHGGEGIETMPLDATIGRCRVVRIRDPESIKPGELEPLRLRRGERVLFKTRNSAEGVRGQRSAPQSWANERFMEDFVYIAREAAEFLVKAGVRTVGVDYLSVGGYHKDSIETHLALLGARIWVLEGLNLAEVEPGAYEMVCLPLKLVGSDGAPARAVLRAL